MVYGGKFPARRSRGAIGESIVKRFKIKKFRVQRGNGVVGASLFCVLRWGCECSDWEMANTLVKHRAFTESLRNL